MANWAHVGGFLFGIAAALLLQHSGLEQKANAAIEAKINLDADVAIVEGTELMNQGKVDEAIAVLKAYLATKCLRASQIGRLVSMLRMPAVCCSSSTGEGTMCRRISKQP